MQAQVMKDTPANEVRANYMKLSRVVHPDKCSHPQAGAASAVLNQVCAGYIIIISTHFSGAISPGLGGTPILPF
jgi:hypothetical protein